MTKLSLWAVVLYLLAFSVFSARVKGRVARTEAFDAFEERLPFGATPPDFALSDLDGTVHALADHVEERSLVLLNFWATWCPPCRLELRQLQTLYERYREQGLRVLAIDVGEEESEVSAFLERHPVGFPVLLDPDAAVAARYRVEAFPTTVLLDGDGRIVDLVEGLDPYLAYRVESLLELPEER